MHLLSSMPFFVGEAGEYLGFLPHGSSARSRRSWCQKGRHTQARGARVGMGTSHRFAVAFTLQAMASTQTVHFSFKIESD